jgi:hypothetical protein
MSTSMLPTHSGCLLGSRPRSGRTPDLSRRNFLQRAGCGLGSLFLFFAAAEQPVRGDTKSKKNKNALPAELEPKLFTLQAKDIPVSKALAELAKQTGNQVADHRPGKEQDRIKLDLKNVTFWQALEVIAKESDARISVSERDARVALVAGPYLALPVCQSGLFRLTVKRVDANYILETDARQCVLHLEVAWEPRFQPLLMQTRPADMVLHDDKGHDLPIQEDEERGGLGAVGQRAGADLRVTLPAPPRAAGHLSLFKGKLGAVGPTKMLTFTFDKLSKIEKKEDARKETQDGVSVSLREFRAEEEGDEQIWTAGLLLEYPADGPKFESFQAWLVNNEIALEKEQDGVQQRVPYINYETGDQTENKAIIRYRFGDDPDKNIKLGKFSDWRLVYRTPGRITELPIPFEFKDIPLP